jgi:hypothetical protein
MRALIVVESVFGNTRAVGEGIAAGLRPAMGAEVAPADGPISLDGVDLLIVGAPTYDHGLSRPFTRKAAKGQAGVHPVNIAYGLREYLADAGAGGGRPAVAFDTRFARPRWLTGSAAVHAARRLRSAGFRVVGAPESFFVEGLRGPLVAGELDRARCWGAQLAGRLAGGAEEHRAA